MKEIRFTSSLSRGETIFALIYFVCHIVLVPLLLLALSLVIPWLDGANLEVVYYGIGLVCVLIFCRKFLRRDFDPLCDRPFRVLSEVVVSYFIMMAMNLFVALLMQAFQAPVTENVNNETIAELADVSTGKTIAIAVFMAPMVEEIIFRAGIFGTIRKRNRLAAYIVCVLAFAAYHVWSYAIDDPSYWLYIIQYIPAGFLLCRCYERTNSIWGSVFFHMLVNTVSLQALSLLEELM